MKTRLFSKLSMLVALSTVLFFVSCSKTPEDLINYVPKESMVVVTARPADLVKKADAEGLMKKMGMDRSDRKEFDKVLDIFNGESGVNMEQVVLFEYDQRGAFLSFIIDDEKKFEEIELIADYTTKHDNKDLTYYEFDDLETLNLVVDGGYAWLAMGEYDADEAIDAVKKFTDLGSDESIASVPGFTENMTAGGDINVYVNIEAAIDLAGLSEDAIDRQLSGMGLTSKDLHIEDYTTSRLYMSLAINKDDMKLTMKMLDGEGKSIMSKLAHGTVDTGMLKYFDRNTTFVYAMTLPDYMNKLFANLKGMMSANAGDTSMLIAEKLLNSVGDNVAVGISFSNDFLTEVYDEYWGEYRIEPNERAIGMTFVVKCKRNMASELSNIATMAGIPTESDGSLVIPVDENMAFKVWADGNYLIASNREAPTASLSDPGFFAGKTAAAYLNMSKNSGLSQSIRNSYGYDIDLTAICYGDKENGVLEVKINNNKEDSALAYFLHLFVELANDPNL